MSQDESRSIQNGKGSTQEVPVIVWDNSGSTSNNLGNAWNNPGSMGGLLKQSERLREHLRCPRTTKLASKTVKGAPRRSQ